MPQPELPSIDKKSALMRRRKERVKAIDLCPRQVPQKTIAGIADIAPRLFYLTSEKQGFQIELRHDACKYRRAKPVVVAKGFKALHAVAVTN